jgi:hypothetical protein
MKKTIKLEVEYASEEGGIKELPTRAYIDKTICGCGFTTVALENELPTIIAVPSVGLIINKETQYPNERCNYKLFGVYGGITKSNIEEYINGHPRNVPMKIMITYDSLHKIEEFIQPYGFRLVIDESNKLLSTSSLKSANKTAAEAKDIISKVLEISCKHKDVVSFISATPTPLKYMPKWVATELDYIKYTWKNTGKTQPYTMKRHFPFKALKQEILYPLETVGHLSIQNMKIKKVIVFLNSVNQIVSLCNTLKLKKKDVAIMCGDNIKNDLKIRGFNRLIDPTNLPKYTFVTSSGFEGIDLEDAEAISIVVSNNTQKHQMLDMLTDLKQAVSRQRIKTNPHYGRFIYIYNQSIVEIPEEELLKKLNKNKETIFKSISLWELAKKEDSKKNTDTRGGFMKNSNFIAYTSFNEETETYEFNEMLYNADRYFITEVRKQYEQGFDISTIVGTEKSVVKPVVIKEMSYNDVVKHILNGKPIKDIRHLVEYMDIIKDSFKFYKKLFLNITYARQMLSLYGDEYKQVTLKVSKTFKIGKIYSVRDVKTKLAKIYKSHKLTTIPKAIDLQQFLNVKNKRTNKGRFIEVIGNKLGFNIQGGQAVNVSKEAEKELMYLIYPDKKKKHKKEAKKAIQMEEYRKSVEKSLLKKNKN